MEFCTGCGEENIAGANFCGKCGATINAVSPVLDQGYYADQVPMVSFTYAVQLAFQKYFDFNGRSTRAEYWWFSLFTFVGSILLSMINPIFQSLFALITLIPSLSLGVRRLHDINKSGWWLLLWFAFLIGWIILIVWAIQKSDAWNNKYGPYPRNFVLK